MFLHHLLWEQDPEGFLGRMDQFLAVADQHKIGVMFVLFDSVWDPFPHAGKQPGPRPRLHNSGWVQSPGARDPREPAPARRAEGPTSRASSAASGTTAGSTPGTCSTSPTTPTPQLRPLRAPQQGAALATLLKKEFAWAR